MKRKINLLICSAILLVTVFTGCSNTATEPTETPSQVETNETTEATPEATTEAEETEEEAPTEEAKEDSGIDKSLTGNALAQAVNALAPKKFDTMILETTTEASGGYTATSISYHKGDNSRSETDLSLDAKQVVIYNAEEGVTYQFATNETQGVMSYDGEDGSVVEGLDYEPATFAELVDASSQDMIARVEDFNGYEVVYVEAHESEEGEEITVKLWYSLEYRHPMQYELYMNDTLAMKSTVTRIETNVDIDDSLFTPPADIEFMEFSVDGLFDMMDDTEE